MPAKKEDDPFGQELEESIKVNELLLRGLRIEAGQKVEAAAAGSGEMPSAFELAQIKKLELQLENDKLFAQGRAMTRKRAGRR